MCATPRLIVSMLSGLVELLARWRALEAEVSKAIYLTFIAFLAGLASLFEVGLTLITHSFHKKIAILLFNRLLILRFHFSYLRACLFYRFRNWKH